jgi:hypothetical protein
MADAEAAPEETGRQPLSAMWRSQGPSPSRVKVYNEEALLDLIKPSTAQGSRVSQTSSFLSRRKAQQRAEKKRLAKEAEQKRVRRYNQQKEDSRMKQAADERKARERVAENANRRERRYEFLRSDIIEGHKLADEVQKHLQLEDMNKQTKLKRQFDEWNSEVYGKIQDQINERLDSTTAAQINARRRREYQKFLDATNAKGAIFRDIIIESEYDPLEPNRHCIKVDTYGLRDPMKRVLDRQYEEQGMLDADSDDEGKKRKPRRPRPHTREVLDIREWATGKIEDTPHGFFAKMMDATPRAPGEKKTSKTYDSKVPFDHYDVQKSLEGEFPRGKKPHLVPTTIKLA